MEACDPSISAWAQQEVSIVSPTKICDSHHTEVHHYWEWFLQLRFPNRNSWVLRNDGDYAIAIQLSTFSSVKPRINSRNIDAAIVARKASH